MSVHPKFSDKSTCLNCAASSDKDTYKGVTSISCHRFAPKPRVNWQRFDIEGEESGSAEPKEVVWPSISDDHCGRMFCLDWVPLPSHNESRWEEYLASLTECARNAIGHEGINSFLALDIAEDSGSLMKRTDSITLWEIRCRREPFKS